MSEPGVAGVDNVEARAVPSREGEALPRWKPFG